MPITWLDNNTDANGARKVAVIRNGYLIWNWPETNVVTRVKSVSKSFINTALGLLIDDGRCLLSTLAKNYDPALVQRSSTVTLRHMTTQTSAMTVKEERTTVMLKADAIGASLFRRLRRSLRPELISDIGSRHPW
jgi:CubicO group peptidase (beta-lactamase class C family)